MSERLFFCMYQQSNSALVGRVDRSGATVLFPKSFPEEKKSEALETVLLANERRLSRRDDARVVLALLRRGAFAWVSVERLPGSPYFDGCSGARELGGELERKIRDFWSWWDGADNVMRQASAFGAEPLRSSGHGAEPHGG